MRQDFEYLCWRKICFGR